MAVKVLLAEGTSQYFVQFGDTETLIFPVETLTRERYERARAECPEFAIVIEQYWQGKAEAAPA